MGVSGAGAQEKIKRGEEKLKYGFNQEENAEPGK